MFDIIFMSYEEPNAEEHWQAVKDKYPWTQRVHGVKGLVNAHRECAKLSARIIDRQKDKETSERLNTWCTVGVGDYADYSIAGAIDGCDYGKYATQDDMVKVNDWEWLRNRFDETTKG